MARILVVVGLPAAGKSEACAVLERHLRHDGHAVTRLSDKHALEAQVLLDIEANGRPGPEPGSLAGRHSILLNPGAPAGTLRMIFEDGTALNDAHRTLLAAMAVAVADGDNGRVALIEWAYGADHPYPREPLRQSGRQFVEWLGQFDLLDEAVVLDVVSSYEEREQRNRGRADGIPAPEFARHFPEAGHFTAEDLRLLAHGYARVENRRISPQEFRSRVSRAYHGLLRFKVATRAGAGARP